MLQMSGSRERSYERQAARAILVSYLGATAASALIVVAAVIFPKTPVRYVLIPFLVFFVLVGVSRLIDLVFALIRRARQRYAASGE